jgi:HD superfamily phosphohydrolase
MAEYSKILHHLDEDYTDPVRDPIWKHIYLSPPLTRIIHTGAFLKLHGIKQLGPTYLVYPGATHTRFSHSLGVFHLARRMIIQLIKTNRKMPLTSDGVKAFLCASLLHDLGHYPYAHSLKDLDVKDHESLTGEYILQDEELSGVIRHELGILPQTVASIIDMKSKKTTDESILFFRNLLSGVLDPDKLDYLNRDAYFCGISYGLQDIDFIYSQIEPHPVMGIAIRRKGLPSVESILFSKYLMYRNVYWHEKVRNATAMIKKAILLGLKSGIIHPENLYGIDDQEFFSRMRADIFPPFRLIEMAHSKKLYRYIYQMRFSDQVPFHLQLEDLEQRLKFEQSIAEKAGASPEQIIVDIPERISFDIELPIIEREKAVPYNESGSVFNEDIVKDFTGSLRTISLLVEDNQDLIEQIESLDLEALFKG